MPNRLITLTIGTKGAEEWFATFQDISELARNLGDVHHHVSVSSIVPDQSEDDAFTEELYHDDNTLNKVRDAIVGGGFTKETANDMINYVLNAGVLFRERMPS